MNDMNNTVIIDVNRFEELIRENESMKLFKNSILTATRLDYRGEDLFISSDDIINALRIVDEQAVNQRERYLKEEYAKKHEEDGADE